MVMQNPIRVVKRTVRPHDDGTTEEVTEEYGQQDSVTLGVNAKGQIQPEIKVYAPRAEEAYQRAKAILEQARKDGLTPEVKP